MTLSTTGMITHTSSEKSRTKNQYQLIVERARQQHKELSLRRAAEINKSEEVLRLIELNVDVNAQDQADTAALHWAAYNDNTKIGKMLLDNKADPNIQDDKGCTPLHITIIRQESTAFLQLLLDNKAKQNIKNKAGFWPDSYLANEKEGRTPIEKINTTKNKLIAASHAILLYARLEKLVALNEQIYDAARCNDYHTLKSLIKEGADINRQDMWFKETALHVTAFYGHLETTELLLKNKARINIQNIKGETPLHIATDRQKSDIILTLLTYGADPNIKNKDGHAPEKYLMHIKGGSPAEKIDTIKNQFQSSIHANLLCNRLEKLAAETEKKIIKENLLPTTHNS